MIVNSVKTEKDIKTAERVRHVKRPAQMKIAKDCHCTSNKQSSCDTWIDQSQRTLHKLGGPRETTSHSKPSQQWDVTSKLQGTDARELSSLSRHCDTWAPAQD